MELEIFVEWLRRMKLPYPWITEAMEYRSDKQKLRGVKLFQYVSQFLDLEGKEK